MKPISSPLADIKPNYDAIVIGSGYGGGIAASRLARAGQEVCLLERGREFLSGEFPDTETEAIGELQFQLKGKHLGDETGLFDIRVQDEQNVVIGCGLGGTSLINASVSLEPTPEEFEHEAWPEAIRQDTGGRLKQGFERAAEMLKPEPFPEDYPFVSKLKAHQKSAEEMGYELKRPPINVCFDTPEDGKNHVGEEQEACGNCGDCISGCNNGAKNTTRMNYLPDAWNHGADIFCFAKVRWIEKRAEGWRVYYQSVESGREVFDAKEMFVDAKIVVLSAGTLGSNEILLRSREKGLILSDQLGQRFTGNGDVLGFGFNADQKINGIGCGETPDEDMEPVGPCITGLIDMRQNIDRSKRMVIEEGSLPGAMSLMLPMAFATASGLIGKDTDSGVLDEIQENTRVLDSLIRGAYHGAVKHTQTYLVMSHDDGDGEIRLENDHVQIEWPNVGHQANFEYVNEQLTKATEALGGTYIKNPVWTDLFNKSLVTVHPLGGCNMADDAGKGVVNHKGQVFTGAGDEIHQGLYVMDGSVIPTSLAVNPLFTISAVSERSCALMAEDYGWQIDYQLPSSTARERPERKPGIKFTEKMTGHFSSQPTSGEGLEPYLKAESFGQESDAEMYFVLTVTSHDLQGMLEDPEHRAYIAGTVTSSALSDSPLTVSEGEFRLFERVDFPPETRQMRYRMKLHAEGGETYYFDGFKQIKDDPNRLDMWSDTTTLYVDIYKLDGEQKIHFGKAVLHIQPQDLMRQLTTMSATNADNLAHRLKLIAQFGQFFAGTLYESYGGIFYDGKPDHPPRKKRTLRAPVPEIFPVQTDDDQTIKLTRYQGGSKGPVMLVHGLGVSSKIFSTDMIETNLVEFLVSHDFDVWLLDLRVSIDLPTARDSFNGDQVAKFDYPAAVNKIRETTGAESVQAVVHCYGATTFFMSMLQGLEGVRSVVTSQVAIDLVPPLITKVKTHLRVPSMLKSLGIDYMNAKVPEDRGGFFTRIYDRLLDFYAMIFAQGRCNEDTCHRITFMYAPLYKHDQLNDTLHSHLGELFGEANMTTLKHLASMCRTQQLVDFHGNSQPYLGHLDRLNLPILLLSGAENQCYLPESTLRTYNTLGNLHGFEQYQREEVEGYAHIDCIFGYKASVDVFPKIVAHLNEHA